MRIRRASPLTLGDTLDERYELVSVLGEGAHSVVYLAQQASLSRKVAIKLIDALGARWFETSAQALREARLLADVVHPNIVTVYDCGSADGQPYIVMEYVPGAALSEVLRARERLDVSDGLDLFSQLARALAAAHARGVVHRDVKPGNVLVSERTDGSMLAKLTDFGVASCAGSTDPAPDGTVLGTPAYMPPEQARGLPVDGRADLYGLGVLMFRALTGRMPFESPDPHTAAVHHVTTPVPWFHDVDRTLRVPAELEAIVRCCLAKHPRDRYPSAAALVAALERVELTSTAGRLARAALATLAARLVPPGSSRLARNHLAAGLLLGLTASAACVAALTEPTAGASTPDPTQAKADVECAPPLRPDRVRTTIGTAASGVHARPFSEGPAPAGSR